MCRFEDLRRSILMTFLAKGEGTWTIGGSGLTIGLLTPFPPSTP
jgi:hypothetical protein